MREGRPQLYMNLKQAFSSTSASSGDPFALWQILLMLPGF